MSISKRIVLLGPDGSGKTRIANYIEGLNVEKSFSQEVFYRSKTIEIPAMYLENRWLTKTVITIVQNQGKALWLLLDGRDPRQVFNEGFSSVFNVPLIGVITHLDSFDGMPEERKKRFDLCKQILLRAGVKTVIDGTDLNNLSQYK